MMKHVADGGAWFNDIADFLGPAYLRYSFTKGTKQEVDFLVDELRLVPGRHRVLDVGCGPGRHAHELARRGIEVHGVDLSPTFVDLARRGAPAGAPATATFEVADARHLAFDGEFDAAISLCQGGFGLVGEEGDAAVLRNMASAVRPGAGRVAFTAFNAYFLVRHLEDHDSFDPATGVNTEQTAVRDEHGAERPATLHTTCFTPRELRLLCRQAGLEPEAIHAVGPGAYGRTRPPDLDSPELLVTAVRL
jgi:SAM-dependent methyltransferase